VVHLGLTGFAREIGTEIVDVYLCPSSFLNEIGVSFSKGDKIAVTGSKVKQEGADLVLPREVVGE
jgi:hypothetical protein